MNPQQIHDIIINPTHDYMGKNYNSISSRFLSLGTCAIESYCGKYNFQIKGPAMSWWQTEPRTHTSVWSNCDALKNKEFAKRILHLAGGHDDYSQDFLSKCPMYACAIARLIYSMTPEPLPKYTGDPNIDLHAFYDYYAEFYHGVDKNGKELGKSTYEKWANAIARLDILSVDLGGIAMSLLSNLFGLGSAEVAKSLGDIVDSLYTSEEEKLTKENIRMRIQQNPQLAQARINEKQATHRSVFVAGARPFLMWVCGLGFLFAFVINPILQWLMPEKGNPDLPLGVMLELTLGMLGLAGLRTIEK